MLLVFIYVINRVNNHVDLKIFLCHVLKTFVLQVIIGNENNIIILTLYVNKYSFKNH